MDKLKKLDKPVALTLVGFDGNAFFLMGAFQKAARRQGVPQDKIDEILDEAQSGDYNHLLATLIANTEEEEEEENEEW